MTAGKLIWELERKISELKDREKALRIRNAELRDKVKELMSRDNSEGTYNENNLQEL